MLVWRKRTRRYPAVECVVSSFSEEVDEIAPRACLTERARAEICRRVGADADLVAEVTRVFGVTWHRDGCSDRPRPPSRRSPVSDRGPKLLLQRAPEAKTVKHRMHLDIDATDIEAEATRLEALGACRVQPDQLHEHGNNWIVVTDPEGNEF